MQNYKTLTAEKIKYIPVRMYMRLVTAPIDIELHISQVFYDAHAKVSSLEECTTEQFVVETG